MFLLMPEMMQNPCKSTITEFGGFDIYKHIHNKSVKWHCGRHTSINEM